MKHDFICANQNIRMSRKVFFSSAHLYNQKKWTTQQNKTQFGKCFSEHGHGHNYILEAFFEGRIQADTGLLANLVDVEPILKSVTDEFDHKHVNFDHPYFQNLVPTTENIATYFLTTLRERLALAGAELSRLHLYKVRLFEEPDLWVEVE